MSTHTISQVVPRGRVSVVNDSRSVSAVHTRVSRSHSPVAFDSISDDPASTSYFDVVPLLTHNEDTASSIEVISCNDIPVRAKAQINTRSLSKELLTKSKQSRAPK